ncbi:MAG: hypothetical protein EXR62_14475 [Chloroflexi bacterium]|nr:hypothetical protein [Chloroflexota bacterium]
MVKNTFDKGPEGWCSYDYHACIVSGRREIFILTSYARQGGVNNSGYIWTDESGWSVDAPEQPMSILALIYYRHWMNLDPIDLRNAEVSVYLRGDDLQLYGAQCYFWAAIGGTRWHCHSQPLTISDGHWGEPNRFTLKNDESLWYRSWAGMPPNPKPLDRALGQALSYGFSFVGFAREVSGKLSMAEFEIKPAQ